ncbi:MAG TPA: STAS domain-containing protein [Actinokineospora sp.]|jgi:anti-anti-sigma factor|nr:STAS domain-containing protein [Actinokineospora sp.]
MPQEHVPSGSIHVERGSHGGSAVLRATGEIDLGTVAVFSAALDDVLADAPAALVVDLTGVGFLGSCGISALAVARQRCADGAVDLRVVATESPVLRILAVTGMDEVLSIFPSVEAAAAS